MTNKLFKTKVLKALEEQKRLKQNVNEIDTIKLILNNVSYQGTFLNLVSVTWINNKRVLSLKDDTKALVKALKGTQ